MIKRLPVYNYDDYEIDIFGNVINIKTNVSIRPFKNHGYLRVNLCKNGKEKHFLVHRLVAETFIPNPNNFTEVNHKDENKENNFVKNLEWCSHKYNSNYGSRNKRLSETLKGENNPFFGKHHTKETKERISKSKQGTSLSEEHKKKISLSMKKYIKERKEIC